jgi:deoxyribose-phosphate aldolase
MSRELNSVIDLSLSNREIVKEEVLELIDKHKNDDTIAIWPLYTFVEKFFAAKVVKATHGSSE